MAEFTAVCGVTTMQDSTIALLHPSGAPAYFSPLLLRAHGGSQSMTCIIFDAVTGHFTCEQLSALSLAPAALRRRKLLPSLVLPTHS